MQNESNSYCFLLPKGMSSKLTSGPCSGCVTLQTVSLDSLTSVWGYDNVTYLGFSIHIFFTFYSVSMHLVCPHALNISWTGTEFYTIYLQYAYMDEFFPATWPELPSIIPYNSSNPIWSSLFIRSPKLLLHSPLLSPPPPPHILLEICSSYNYSKPEKFLCGIWWGGGGDTCAIVKVLSHCKTVICFVSQEQLNRVADTPGS